jgi:uncharacterized protein YqeY
MISQEKIQLQMAEAMRNKDVLRLSVLRMMKSALQVKTVEKMRPLEEAEVTAVLNSLVKQRKDSAQQFRAGAREEMALKEEAEIKILEEFLPAAASDSEVRLAIDQAIRETGAASIKDMGKVMKAAMASLSGKTVDGSRISQFVKERLSGLSA